MLSFDNFKTMAAHVTALACIERVATVERVERPLTAAQALSVEREVTMFALKVGPVNAIASSGDLYGEDAAFLNVVSEDRESFLAISFRPDGTWYGDDEPISARDAAYDEYDPYADEIADAENGHGQHEGHYSRIGGTYWCDTCDSPYCELA